MKKDEKLKEIRSLAECINENITRHTKHFKPLRHFEAVDYEDVPVLVVNETYRWIKDIEASFLLGVKRVRRLLPESQWDLYYSMYEDYWDTREAIMLKDAVNKLIESIKAKPTFFRQVDLVVAIRKHKKAKNENNG
jgi:hypothetical protein